jgi:hypothetical protein
MNCKTAKNLDNITLQDCEELFETENTRVTINDGRIVELVKE